MAINVSVQHNGGFLPDIILIRLLSKTCPIHTNSGCGKGEAHINWSMVTCKMAAPVTGTTLRTTGPVPADSRQ